MARTESGLQRLIAGAVGRPLFWVVLVGTLFALPLVRALRRELPPAQPVLGEIPPFTASIATGEKAGRKFDDAELLGRVWVAAFIDPADPACDRLAEQLFTVNRRAKNLGDAWRVVSFVPTGADPKLLAAFAERHHPNPWRWYFLGVPAPVETAVAGALHHSGAIAPLGTVGSGVVHASHLVALVDRNRRVRAFYDLSGKPGMDALLADMGLLANLDR